MRIGLFCNTFNAGGAETVMVTLANNFIEKGHQVDFIVCQNVGALSNDIKDSVNVIDLKTTKTRNSIFKLAKVLRVNKPDVLLSTQTHINLASVLANIFSFWSTSVIIREASTPSKMESQQKKNRIINIINKLLYRNADAIVSVSLESQKDIIDFYKLNPSKIHNIYNPIFSNDLISKAKESVSHRWFSKKHKVIIGMGRIVPAKNFKNLILAFAKVNQILPETRLLLLGGTRPRFKHVHDEILNLIEENGLIEKVQLHGFVKNPFSYLSKASLFVLSSDWEGLPGGLIQAMACGCPVVSTMCKSGPTEILDNGKYGELVEVNNPEALSEAMIRTIKKEKVEKILIGRAKYFNVDNSVNNYLDFFSTIAEKK